MAGIVHREDEMKTAKKIIEALKKNPKIKLIVIQPRPKEVVELEMLLAERRGRRQ